MRKLLQVASVLGMTALSLMVFAETEYVNDLKPFDNTIEWDGFWATTNHADVAVSSEMAGLSGGFASGGAFDADPVNLDEFDSRLCTWGEDVFDGFSSERVGMLILVR